jgi:hypothetical protein
MEGGFTVLEILIALAVTTIGLAAVMMVQSTVIKGNRYGQRFERAKLLAEQTMEELRGRDVSPFESMVVTLPYYEREGVMYRPQFGVEYLPGTENLMMVTVQVSFGEEGDESDRRIAQLQMIRTKQEVL